VVEQTAADSSRKYMEKQEQRKKVEVFDGKDVEYKSKLIKVF